MVLPLELVEKIIDELATDKKSLLACSYVSPSFYVRTRFHLFKGFNLYYPKPQDQLLRLAAFWEEHPHIPSYIRTLYFSTAFLSEPEAPRILRHLRNVKDAYMKDFEIHHFGYSDALETLATIRIGTLTINESHFGSLGAFAYAIRCFPWLYSLDLASTSISASGDFPWVNNLEGCDAPYLKHLKVLARSVGTRESNTVLFARFPFHNQPFHTNDLKTFEVLCANQTDLIRLGRFLPYTLRTLKNLSIIKIDNGVSGGPDAQPLPWVQCIRPLALDSSQRLLIDVGFKVGYYADYLRWWIAGMSDAANLRIVHVCLAMALGYLDKAEDKPWRNVWRAFNKVLEEKGALEQVVVMLQIPAAPNLFRGRKKGIERECKGLVKRGVMRVVFPEKMGLETF